MKRNGTRAEREAYETLNCNLLERKKGTAGKEANFVDQLLFGIVVVIIIGALLSLGLK